MIANDNAGPLTARVIPTYVASPLSSTKKNAFSEIVENNIRKLPNRDIKPLQIVVLSQF